MKLSFHNQRGGRHALHGYRPWHNDGSMYRDDTERFEQGRKMNGHWDMYSPDGRFITGGAQVGRTCSAVNKFYEEKLRGEYAAKLESTSWKKNPDRIKTFDEYCDDKNHCLNETIVGLGNIDDPGDPHCLLYSVRRVKRVMEQLGVTVIAVDVHLDEATPHAHILWAGVASDGTFNLNKTLDEHGVEKAKPERRKIRSKNGKMRTETAKEYERRCTRQATFTAAVRQAAEDAADEWLKKNGFPLLDRERSDKPNESLNEYRSRKERENQFAREAAREDIYDEVFQQTRDELRPHVREIKRRDKESRERTKALDARENALSEREAEAQKRLEAAMALEKRCAGRAKELDEREDAADEREGAIERREGALGQRESALEKREQDIERDAKESQRQGYEIGKARGIEAGRAEVEAAKQRYETALTDLRDLDVKRQELTRVTGELTDAKRELSEIAPALSGAKRTIADADAYAQKRRDEADAEADEVVRSTAKRWGGGPLKLFQTMLTVTMQFCASRSREPGDAWEQRGAVLREAMSVVDDLIGHRSERVRELFKQKFEQRLVDYDREERRKNVTYVTPTYTAPSTRQRSDREFGY